MSLLSRRPLARLAAAGALACALGTAGAADEPRHVVQDPHYGDTLFHFYQGRYFTAVTNLMVSQHFERMPHHADEAEVLRGGLLLSYGLHREAGEIFARLIETTTQPAVRDRAWFYLAKIRYQRGFHAEAEQATERIVGELPGELQEERLLLQANLLMARGDYAAAAALLGGAAGKASAGQYARYNLGVALVRNGEVEPGTALLDTLGQAPAANEELRSLRDQANVALGFTALQAGQPDAAQLYLQRVRLSGLHANKALLGFGWAAAAMKQPRQALVPWTELAQRDASDPAVLEARIAVPYAYAELNAYGQAMEQYQAAIAAFEREGAALDETVAAIRAGKLVEGLIERNPGEEMGWFWNIRELPEMPHAAHLTQVLARHEFQEAFKNYRDLHFLAKNLQQWQDQLGVFGDMLATRRQAYAQRLPEVRAKAGGIGLEALQSRADELTRELAQAEELADGAAFADAKERDLQARLARVREALAQAGQGEEASAARERYLLAAGALTWQLAQQYPARRWEARKGMRAVEQQLGQARQRDTALAQAQRDEPARFERFAARIAALGPRIQALIPRVADLSREQQHALQELAVAELTRQKERLAVYATQARFAVAQLYDRAAVSRSAEDALKQ